MQEPRSTGYGLGISPLVSGVYLLPMTVAVAVPEFMTGPLEQHVGARRLLIAGNIFSAGAFVLLTVARSARVEILCASGLLGLGTGIALAALATLIVANVGQHETGVASGVNNVARALGGAVGGQLAAALLAATAGLAGVPSATGYTRAFMVGLVALVVATGVGPLLPQRLENPTAEVGLTVLR